MLYDFIIPEIFNISTIPRTTLSYRKIREKRGETGGKTNEYFHKKKYRLFLLFLFSFSPSQKQTPGMSVRPKDKSICLLTQQRRRETRGNRNTNPSLPLPETFEKIKNPGKLIRIRTRLTHRAQHYVWKTYCVERKLFAKKKKKKKKETRKRDKEGRTEGEGGGARRYRSLSTEIPRPGGVFHHFLQDSWNIETRSSKRASGTRDRGLSSIITDVNYVRTWIGTRGDYGAGVNGRVRGQRKPEPVDECARCRTAKSAHARPDGACVLAHGVWPRVGNICKPNFNTGINLTRGGRRVWGS